MAMENFHKFVTCCDIISTDLSTADSTMLLNIVKSKLSGTAYNLIKYKTFSNWGELKTELQNQFLEVRTLAQIQTDLVVCKQGLSEDVRAYANRVERLLADLNDACISSEGSNAADIVQSLNGKTALKSFVDGLNNSVKLIIKASRFQKLSEAIEAAVQEEKTAQKNITKFSKERPSSHSAKHLKCNFCSKNGHTSESCFQKLNNYRPPPKPPVIVKREPLHSTFVVTCSYCRNRGHHIKECRKRQYNENRKKENQTRTQHNNYLQQVSGNPDSSGATGGATRAIQMK